MSTVTPNIMKPRTDTVIQPEIVMMSGVSGSGKSTWARTWVAADPDHRVRVNRDDIRSMMFTKADYTGVQEEMLTAASNALMVAALNLGKSVVVDNTHLHPRFAQELSKFAETQSVRFRVQTMAPITFEVAQSRIQKRAGKGGLMVPDEVLKNQLKQQAKFSQ